jgi:uncharacterized membrane protein
MKLQAAALVAALLIAVAGCNNDDLPPAAANATVSGVVTDGSTNKPVAGAVVTIDTVLTATTDATGKFTVANVPGGIADYSVQAQGYQVLTSTANVEPGKKAFELDVTLTAAASPPPH